MDSIGVIVCNGPSLADVPVDWLNDKQTLASNSFYAKEGFVPNYWFLEGRGHLKKESERLARAEHMEIPGVVLVNSQYAWADEFDRFQGKIYPITYWTEGNKKIIGFQPKPTITGHGTANSVTYAMFQYAYQWEFDPLLIVGMDMKFSKDGHWHFYDFEEVPEFHEMEYKRFLQWRGRAEESYQECADYFADNGRTVLNLTPDTACEAFETDELENWL
jgi:hypothetical protein